MKFSAIKKFLNPPPEKYDDDVFSPDALTRQHDALLRAIVLFFAVFVIWACAAHVDELARGTARIIPADRVQVIQNLEGGIMEKIFVKQGDTVEANQLLARLSGVRAASEYQANLGKLLALKAAIVRLQAEVSGVPPEFPDDLRRDAPEAVAAEAAAWEADFRENGDRLSILEQQYNQKQQESEGGAGKLEGAEKLLKMSKDERDIISPLVESGAVSKVDLLQLNGRIASEAADVKNLRAALAQQKAAMQEMEERISENRSAVEADARKEIAAKTAEMNTAEETLRNYRDQAQRTEIRSPARGRVKEIKVTTAGGVVQPGQDIMEIVPDGGRLVIEASISPSDIAFLYPGQKATVKITAYDYAIFGSIAATVAEISPDTIRNDKGESFYRVTLEADHATLSYKGETLPIIPGMVASADIVTGKKTVMSYLLSRFRKPLLNAMHER